MWRMLGHGLHASAALCIVAMPKTTRKTAAVSERPGSACLCAPWYRLRHGMAGRRANTLTCSKPVHICTCTYMEYGHVCPGPAAALSRGTEDSPGELSILHLLLPKYGDDQLE